MNEILIHNKILKILVLIPFFTWRSSWRISNNNVKSRYKRLMGAMHYEKEMTHVMTLIITKNSKTFGKSHFPLVSFLGKSKIN